jgi:HlyD family secretion protein
MKQKLPSRTQQPTVWRASFPITVGFVALIVLVFGLGIWSVSTKLAGAVIATGTVQIQSNRQIVQHAEGGVVGEIFVRNGDIVTAGQTLIRFDDTLSRSELAIVEGQLSEMWARSARLQAERDDLQTIPLPHEIQLQAGLSDHSLNGTDKMTRAIEGQRRLFFARNETRAKQADQLHEQIAQLEHQIEGTNAQITALNTQLNLIAQDLDGQNKLLKKGLTHSQNVTTLEREKANLAGEIGRLNAATAQLSGQIATTKIDILRIDTQRREAAITELRDAEFRMVELSERRLSLLERLSRMDVRAPTAGIIYGSTIFAKRAVVQPAEPMMFVIPQNQPLVALARVEPLSVDQIFVGQAAVLRFPAFDQRLTPELLSDVQRVSADVFNDQATGASYYEVELSLDPKELEKLGDQDLLPGMPIEAYLKTGERTPLSYLTKPLMDYFYKAFKG